MRAYASYLQIKDKTEDLWAEQFKANKGQLADYKISKLREKLNEPKDRIDLLMQALHCPTSGNINIIDLYKKFTALKKDEQENFIAGKNVTAIVNILFPPNNAVTLFSAAKKADEKPIIPDNKTVLASLSHYPV
jgi:hypothetical protein